MRTLLVTLALTVAFLAHAEEENPLKKANVGDWVEWKTATKAGGFAMEGNMKQTLVAKTDSEATLEVANNMQGQEFKQQVKVNLNEKYDPRKTAPGAEVKELGKGEESLTVAGKTVKTQWSEYQITMDHGGQKMTVKGKAWVSKDVPLGGLVKMESEMGGLGKQSMELVGFGSK